MMVAVHLCNPSYLGCRDQKDQFEPNLGKRFIRPAPSQPIAAYGGCAPVIPETWQAEIRKIEGAGQPRPKKLHKNTSQKKRLGVSYMSVIPATMGSINRRAWAKSKTLSQKYPEQKGLDV
jgi:hypothetical protein